MGQVVEDGIIAPQLYARRWYILALFSFICLNQCNVWITYGATATTSQELYSVGSSLINFLSAAGPIAFIAVFPLSTWATGRWGLRAAVLSASGLVAAGAVLRAVARGPYAFWMVIVAQFLNAAAGPVCMSLPPAVSAAWFPVDERTFATAISSLCGFFGSAVGFLFGLLVHTPSDLMMLLYIEGAVCLGFFILVLVYFPSSPPTAPTLSAMRRSHAATPTATATVTFTATAIDETAPLLHHGPSVIMVADVVADVDGPSLVSVLHKKPASASWGILLRQSATLVSSKDPAALIFSCGLLGGMYSGWSSMLIIILVKLGYSQSDGQWLGFVNCAVGLVSGLLCGRIHDKLFRSFKSLLLILCAATAVSYAAFSVFTSTMSVAGVHWAPMVVMVANIAGGFAVNAVIPLSLEAMSEVSYPMNEEIGAGLLSLVNNFAALVFLFVGDIITPTFMNWSLTGTAIFSFLCIATVRERYGRTEVDMKHSKDIN